MQGGASGRQSLPETPFHFYAAAYGELLLYGEKVAPVKNELAN